MQQDVSRRFIRSTTFCFFLLLASGAALTFYPGGIFGISGLIYWLIDFPDAAISVAIMFAISLVVARLPESALTRIGLDAGDPVKLVGLMACMGLLLAVAGTRFVYHEYALSMDEWMPRLQSEIFASKALTATVSAEWRPWGHMIYDSFATFDPDSGQLASGYRPGLAALIALANVIGNGAYISSFFFAGSIILVALVTRQIAPTLPRAPVIAALLMVTSSQALVAGMTTYAMPAHLFFNLLWLHFFLRDRMIWHVVAALIGVITASLHQVHMHLFFALPFFVLLLNPLRLGPLLIYGVIYLIGHLLVIGWDSVLISETTGKTSLGSETTREILARIFKLPGVTDLSAVWTNLGRLVLWQNLAFVPLFAAYFLLMRSYRNRLVVLLLSSTALSLVPYIFLMPDQGHGWGYRYLHGLLGNLFIVAAIAWETSLANQTYTRIRTFVILLLIASPLIMFPIRGFQVSSFVGKYHQATTWVHSLDADVVIVDDFEVPIGSDIPRNSALAPERPVVMYMHTASPEDLSRLCSRYDVLVLSGEDFEHVGLRPITFTLPIVVNAHNMLLDTMDASGCRRLSTEPSESGAAQQ
ncbi:hypothetical protein EI983_08660 [Roseovarius faecimaris]|uniref:Glycosyltransferase RgtA/B/C/D-like domain-containing protein n=1 Tax=Roseovarius faecimaris TaxID=2494550 RepID=A0A6I6IS64_9RHOB|nr:hypothetical protein [Roseovarius faecimaris]QGX98347.1 hypothetical protein EI983_08660 [Roseovarius faecimaris]